MPKDHTRPDAADADAAGAHAPVHQLLRAPPRVVNVGLESFAEDLRERAVAVVHVQWSPPAGGDPRRQALLDKLGG